jgi:hypothetical protein
MAALLLFFPISASSWEGEGSGEIHVNPPQTGTISVTSEPSGASFTLDGPTHYTGTTPWSQTEAPVGTYTVTWGSVNGYGTPSAESKRLTKGGSISFFGAYESVAAIPTPTARLDAQLLDTIDSLASDYYNPDWNATLAQFKAWIAAIAWAEGGSGGCVAHSQLVLGSDVFNHKTLGAAFRFSTGIGSFQLDRGGLDGWGLWPTIEKLDYVKATVSVLAWHKATFGSGATLEDFAVQSPWFAVNPSQGGNPAGHWEAVTGTGWNAHNAGIASLNWNSIKSQLETRAALNITYAGNVQDLGQLEWHIQIGDNVLTDSGKAVVFNGSYSTWRITARNWGGTALFSYYYTHRPDSQVELWVLDDSGSASPFRHIFVREYGTGPLPENRSTSGSIAGETLSGPALTLGGSPSVPSVSPAELRSTITHRLQWEVSYPPYLLDPDSFASAVTTAWLEVTSPLTGNLTDKYDEMYWAGIDYDCLRIRALTKARDALNREDIVNAQEYLERSEVYGKLSLISFQAAIEVFNRDLEVAEQLAQAVRKGSEEAVKFGVSVGVSPKAGKAVEYVYIAADWAVDSVVGGAEQATKDAIVKAAISAVFNEVKWTELGDETLSDWLKNRTGRYVFPTLRKLPWENVQWILSKMTKQAVVRLGKWGVGLGESELERIVKSVIGDLKGALDYEEVRLKSPAELRVYDSQGRTTGLVKRELRNEIPRSVYDNGGIMILFPTDFYRYAVVGTDEGSYGIDITSIKNAETNTLSLTSIPTTTRVVHRYAIDWGALSRGEKGVTMQIDSDADGVFERTTAIQPPVASLALFPQSPVVGQAVTFDASTSVDEDGEIVSYQWDFGDGNEASRREVTHTYTVAGDYAVSLMVTDDDGAQSTYVRVLQVREGWTPWLLWTLIASGAAIVIIATLVIWRRVAGKRVAKP